ncbi:hypothetical protein P5704_026370 (plasmid) [Pseudomonas sp. FeN3W]|nr:hypothetical protein P5704_026370 [Pseudomonas sp. FeN3W]
MQSSLKTPSPSDINTLLLDDFAVRTAHAANFLGLDDPDEQLLWRYLALRKKDAEPSVIACLKEHAELTAFEIKRAKADVSIAAQWVKPSGLFSAQKPLMAKLNFDSLINQVDFRSREEILKAATDEACDTAFKLWYEKLSSRQINGKLVEVSASDIIVELDLEIVELRQLLESF